MRLLYNFGIWVYYLLALFISLFNNKAKKWISGQREIFQYLKNNTFDSTKIAWFHAASLGEFEQGRPVIESFKKSHTDYKIIITFFSPSGYEIRKNYEYADYVCYLPIDTYSKAKRFIQIIKPDIVFFIKYEFWFNYLKILHDSKIPTYLISGIFRENQHFFKIYGIWFKKQLKHFTYFFVQNTISKSLLNSIGYQNVSVSGDTRFDRVSQIAENPKKFPLIEQFKNNKKLVLIGSSWEPDENIIFDFIKTNKKEIKFIFAPHEVHNDRINKLQSSLSTKSILFSELNENNSSDADVLIINNIGILSYLYQYADIAIIGGGFGKGIHNILEAATFGVPVIFGPNFQKFTEAKDLIDLKGAFSINNVSDFIKTITPLLDDNVQYLLARERCLNYIKTQKGATEIILGNIKV